MPVEIVTLLSLVTSSAGIAEASLQAPGMTFKQQLREEQDANISSAATAYTQGLRRSGYPSHVGTSAYCVQRQIVTQLFSR